MADAADIADALDALATHCRPPLMGVEARSLWMRDWCEDLAGHPLAAIRRACASWRQGGQAKFPTPGQLLPLVRSLSAEPQPSAHAGPWRPLTDGEYDAAPLSGKVRHHQGMADAASLKAAQLWRRLARAEQGAPPSFQAPPDDDGRDWAVWRRRELAHRAEVRRLKGVMAAAQERRMEREGLR